MATVATAALAQAQVLVEDFSALTPGTPITTENSVFTLIRNLGNQDALKAVDSSMGSGRSMLITSSLSNSMANYVGVGKDGLASSNVFSLSLDIKSTNWRTNHGLIIAMGSGDSGFYSPDGNIANSNIYNDSLFAIRLMGNSNAGSNPNSAKLQTMGSGGWADHAEAANVIANAMTTNFHFVVNGGDVDLSVGDVTISGGHMGIWLNGEYLSEYEIGGITSATSLRIFAHGRGGSYTTTLDVEIGDIKIWDSAVAPIPEPATAVLTMAGIVAACLLLRHYRR